MELLVANVKNPLHQKEPEGFAGFDEQLHFLSLQTEYYDPGVRTGAKWRCLWVFFFFFLPEVLLKI